MEHHVTAFSLPASVPANEEAQARLSRMSKRNAAFIGKHMKERGFDKPCLWLNCPDQVELAFELSQCDGLVYDCDQHWEELPSEWESVLCGEANLSLAASEQIQKRLSQFSDNVALLPNGVNYALFSLASRTYSSFPADLQQIPQPVFGYLGEVDDFIQLEPIRYTAEAHPDWHFVFVGPYSRLNAGYSRMRRLKNVHFLGEKSLPSLPRYLSGFRVCFSLLNEHKPVAATVPEQLHQYLGSGKPVVRMVQPDDMLFYPDVTYAAHFEVEFEQACQTALNETSPALVRKRIQFAADADWSQLAQRLAQILNTNGLF